MTSKKIIITIIIILSALSIFIYVSIHGRQNGGGNLISPQNIFKSNSESAKPTFTPPATAGPTPIILDLKNGLSKEVEKLTPDDFSPDFEILKKSF
ncbi:MAG: hypothetical protein Q7R97_00560 [Candidatus Daviesbacteria bacterium]|nr:hypothetical protein [Candidatus Daviesbacteria bacterium]